MANMLPWPVPEEKAVMVELRILLKGWVLVEFKEKKTYKSYFVVQDRYNASAIVPAKVLIPKPV